jgi:hypothetical protein
MHFLNGGDPRSVTAASHEKIPASIWAQQNEAGKCCGFSAVLVHSFWQIAQRRLRSIGAGGSEDEAELHGTTPMGIGNSKVLGVSGAPRAGS